MKRIDIAEFRDRGFLQEANRRFFHPLGLALEVIVEKDGTCTLGGVWDYRDDPEGMFFDKEDCLSQDFTDKKNHVTSLLFSKLVARANNPHDVEVNIDGIQLVGKKDA